MVEDIYTIKIDFDKLDEYNELSINNGGFPILSCIQLYKACGLYEYIEDYYKEHTDEKPCALDNIQTNFNTLQRIKRYIEDVWGCYNLSIDGDHNIIWTEERHDKRNHAKTLKSIVESSVLQDFRDYCPGLDDALEDDIIVFRIYHPDPEESEVVGEVS